MAIPESEADLLTAKEAGRMLGVGVSMVRGYTRSGILPFVRPGRSSRSPRLYKIDDVAALVEAKSKDTSLAAVATMAKQAYVSSQNTEKLLSKLLTVLGVDTKPLVLTELAILQLYAEAEELIESELPLSSSKILEWARVFYVVTEEYLGLVEQYTESTEPWKVFLDLGNKINHQTIQLHDTEMFVVNSYFMMAHRNVRNVAYFYVRHSKGQKLAESLFPASKGDVHEDIIALAFPG
jgi:hypothetical protein